MAVEMEAVFKSMLPHIYEVHTMFFDDRCFGNGDGIFKQAGFQVEFRESTFQQIPVVHGFKINGQVVVVFRYR